MGFLGFTALAVAVLLTYAGVKGLSPVDSLRAFLRGEPQPAPKYLIQAAEPTAGRAGGFAGSNGIGVLLPAGQKLMRPVSPWRISSGFGVDRGYPDSRRSGRAGGRGELGRYRRDPYPHRPRQRPTDGLHASVAAD